MEFEELIRIVPPLADSTLYGIDLYEKALDYVYKKVENVQCVPHATQLLTSMFC